MTCGGTVTYTLTELTELAEVHARGRAALLHEPTGGDPGKLTLVKEDFDLGYHFKHVDTIFERVFGKAAVESKPRR